MHVNYTSVSAWTVTQTTRILNTPKMAIKSLFNWVANAIFWGLMLNNTSVLAFAKSSRVEVNPGTKNMDCRKMDGSTYDQAINLIDKVAENASGQGEGGENFQATYLKLLCMQQHGDTKMIAKSGKEMLSKLKKQNRLEVAKYFNFACNTIADSLWQEGDKEASLYVLREGRLLAKILGDQEASLDIQINILSKLLASNQIEEAQPVASEIKPLLEQQQTSKPTKSRQIKAYYYIQMGYLYYKSNNNKLAEEFFEKARVNAANSQDVNSLWFASFMLIQIESNLEERITKAKRFASSAKINCEKYLDAGDNSLGNKFCREAYYFIYGEEGLKALRNMNPLKAVQYLEKASTYVPKQNEYLYLNYSNLAYAYTQIHTAEGYKNAINNGLKALKILDDIGKRDSIQYAEETRRLAGAYSELGEYQQAQKLLDLAMKAALKLPNREPMLASIGRDEGNISYNKGGLSTKQSKDLEIEVNRLKELKRTNQKPSLDLAIELLNLAATRLDSGNEDAAVIIAEDSVNEVIRFLRSQLIQADMVNMEHIKEYSIGDLDAIYSFADRSQLTRDLAFHVSLNLQGLVQEMTIKSTNRAIPGRDQEEIAPVYKETIAKQLKENEYLVIMKKFKKWERNRPRLDRWQPSQYLALILDHKGITRVSNIGESAEIDKLIYSAITNSQQNLVDAGDGWQLIANKILDPILSVIGSKPLKLYFAADGELNQVPLSAISLLDSSNRVPNTIVNLISGRDLLRVNSISPTAHQYEKPVVIANPDFGVLRKTKTLLSPTKSGTARSQGDTWQWKALPGTLLEGKIVSNLIKANLYTGAKANSSLLKHLKSPRILHIATHAFWRPQKSNDIDQAWDTLRELNRSGLVLSGANVEKWGIHNTYISSAELASMDLRRTELVVLSACSTGQGSGRSGERIYGLQKAVSLAGVRSSLVSLWKVDDQATAEFMKRFYMLLKRGESLVAALKTVQDEFMRGKVSSPTKGENWTRPYYWAAWQLVGDWRPIPGL